MKGRIRVEITDSKGNTKVHEQDNLVTNAYKNVFKTLTNYWCNVRNNGANSNANYLNNLFSISDSLVKSLFGGLLVFNDNLSNVDASHLLASANDAGKYVGCANSKTSSVGTMKGTFNTNESEFTDSYAKFVWNFSAGQIYNQNIGAFALTSDAGGQHGLGNTAVESNQKADSFISPVLGSTMWDNTNTDTNSITASQDAIVKLANNVEPNFTEKAVYYDETNNELTVAYYNYTTGLTVRVLDLNKFKIDANFNGSFGEADSTQETTYAPTNTLRYGYSWLRTRGINCPYMYRSHREWGKGTDHEIHQISLADGTDTNLGEFDPDYIDSVNNYSGTGDPRSCVLYESNVPYHYTYKLNSTKDGIRFWKANMVDKTWTYADVALTADAQSMFGMTNSDFDNRGAWVFIKDSLYIPSYSAFSNQCYNLFRVSSSLGLTQTPELQVRLGQRPEQSGFLNLVKSPLLAEPVLVMDTINVSGLYHIPVIAATYLSTIANLDQVLTKPADGTMKVTYTVYNGSQPNQQAS